MFIGVVLQNNPIQRAPSLTFTTLIHSSVFFSVYQPGSNTRLLLKTLKALQPLIRSSGYSGFSLSFLFLNGAEAVGIDQQFVDISFSTVVRPSFLIKARERHKNTRIQALGRIGNRLSIDKGTSTSSNRENGPAFARRMVDQGLADRVTLSLKKFLTHFGDGLGERNDFGLVGNCASIYFRNRLEGSWCPSAQHSSP